MPDPHGADVSSVRALLVEIRRKAMLTAKWWLGERDAWTSQENDWIRDDEVSLVENLVRAIAQQAKLSSHEMSLWKSCREFAHEHAKPWSSIERAKDESWNDGQKKYELHESKFHEGISMWVLHTLDFLKVLEFRSAASSELGRKTVLFLAANPSEDTRLRLDLECREIREELERAKFRDNFRLETRGAVRLRDLSRALLELEPEIVHFSGHGSDFGALILEGDNGCAHYVELESLANLFNATSKIRCVILNACHSEIQAAVIGKCVPYVIGMRRAIGDEAAIKFSQGFYRAMGAGYDISAAFDAGLRNVASCNLPGENIPKLLSNATLCD